MDCMIAVICKCEKVWRFVLMKKVVISFKWFGRLERTKQRPSDGLYTHLALILPYGHGTPTRTSIGFEFYTAFLPCFGLDGARLYRHTFVYSRDAVDIRRYETMAKTIRQSPAKEQTGG